MSFTQFDPLEAKQSLANEAALTSVKREIQNILDSYVGWFDPFAELIQHALDAIDERRTLNDGLTPISELRSTLAETCSASLITELG